MRKPYGYGRGNTGSWLDRIKKPLMTCDKCITLCGCIPCEDKVRCIRR